MPDSSELDVVADELYGLRPDEFIAERDAAVARAREAGDRDLAKAIGRLRRPTRAAWLANLLARHRAEQLDGLVGLAAGLADAQRTLDGDTLRALSGQRNKLVRAMAQQAGQLARAVREPVTESLLRELQGILEAALADPEIAEEVRSGRLTRSVTYSGFGPESSPGAIPVRRPPPVAPPVEEPVEEEDAGREQREWEEREQRERRERAERELADAVAEEQWALERQHADEAARDEASAAQLDAHDRVADLAAELDAAREKERIATAAARQAEATAKASARAAGAAATRTARAKALLDGLSNHRT